MDSTRQKKIARLIHKELAGIFQHLSKDVTNGRMMTITMARVTPDLGLAKIYLSIFPSNENQQVLENIKSHASSIRHQLAQKIRHQVKSIPEIQFYIDDSLDYIENIEKLLK